MRLLSLVAELQRDLFASQSRISRENAHQLTITLFRALDNQVLLDCHANYLRNPFKTSPYKLKLHDQGARPRVHIGQDLIVVEIVHSLCLEQQLDFLRG
jgi:hypothetical protein